MTTAQILENELTTVLYGQPWYGSSVYAILDAITFESAYEKPAGASHTIAAIILHMVSWTEEVIDRINEKPAGLPLSGDWPDTGKPDEEKWKNWIEDFKLVNVNLVKLIRDVPETHWEQPIIDERETEVVVTHAQLVRGLVQHHIYHSGQIALLNKMIRG